jgi:hypothetical protein
VPFSKDNRMDTLTILASTIIIVGALAVEFLHRTKASDTARTVLLVALGLKVLLVMLQNRRSLNTLRKENEATQSKVAEATTLIERHTTDAKAARADISAKVDDMVRATNGGLSAAVRTAGEEARKGEREQMLDDPAFMERVVEHFRKAHPCEDVAIKAALKGAELGAEAALRRAGLIPTLSAPSSSPSSPPSGSSEPSGPS